MCSPFFSSSVALSSSYVLSFTLFPFLFFLSFVFCLLPSSGLFVSFSFLSLNYSSFSSSRSLEMFFYLPLFSFPPSIFPSCVLLPSLLDRSLPLLSSLFSYLIFPLASSSTLLLHCRHAIFLPLPLSHSFSLQLPNPPFPPPSSLQPPSLPPTFQDITKTSQFLNLAQKKRK